MVDAGVRHRESSCQHPEKGFSSVDATAGDRVMQRRRPRWSNVGGPAWRGRPSLQGLCGAHSGGRDPGGKVFPASLFLILFQLKMKVRSCFCCWSQQSFLCPKPSLSAVWDDCVAMFHQSDLLLIKRFLVLVVRITWKIWQRQDLVQTLIMETLPINIYHLTGICIFCWAIVTFSVKSNQSNIKTPAVLCLYTLYREGKHNDPKIKLGFANC